jgi:NodT family efflux transporter outer membrane factor (OMF) lipoprotein
MGIISLLGFMAASCTVGPKYKPPELTYSDEWHTQESSSVDISLQDSITTRWWEVFQDELLTKYIEKAASCNHTVLMAEANIQQARALKKVSVSQFFPQLGLDFAGSKTYFSKNGPVFSGPSLVGGVSSVTGLPFQLQIPQVQPLYNALIDVSWEIDLFGRIRNEVKARTAMIGSAEEAKKGVLLSVFSEIAMNYMQLRATQQQGVLVEQNIELLEAIEKISQENVSKGLSSELDLVQIQAMLAKAQAELPLIYAQVYQSIYALSILIAEAPETLLPELLPIQNLPNLPENVVVGLRSDLLRRRPDVGQAERLLAAATANVGVAISSFFPRFTLGGDLGFQSLKFINLFTGMSKTWSIGGDVNMPLFQGGKLIGNLRVSESQAVFAAQSYEQAVLTALQEAESALSRYEADLKTLNSLEESVEKEKKACFIVQQQYEQGYSNRTQLLQIEMDLNTSKEEELEGRSNSLLDLIVLYKTLGGGFEPFSP